MAGGPVGTPATPARGTHHGVVVAVHHQRPPSSQVDVLFPPVAHLWGPRGQSTGELSRSHTGWRGPRGAGRLVGASVDVGHTPRPAWEPKPKCELSTALHRRLIGTAHAPARLQPRLLAPSVTPNTSSSRTPHPVWPAKWLRSPHAGRPGGFVARTGARRHRRVASVRTYVVSGPPGF